ncbi:P-loop containing nucleoside triphosphate hydrolase protein [Aspergillus carlsbadensis]|nr:P-loop containing nucleoside triphosphate hydrolase protein [Aspergillus carlsbadensis]
MSLPRCLSTPCRRTLFSLFPDPIQRVRGFTSPIKSQQPGRRSYTPRRRSKPLNLKGSESANKETKDVFIGREDDLKNLWTWLRPQAPPERRVTVLHGPDGVGKTQLARQFAHLHADDFGPIWWVDGSSRNTMLASLGKLASQLPTSEILSHLSKPTSGGNVLERQASIVLDFLRKRENTRSLLIVDGLAADKVRLADYKLNYDHGAILITTTEPSLVGGTHHAVQPLGPQHALAIVTPAGSDLASGVQRNESEEQAMKMLVRSLDGLPVAHVLAAAYMRQTGLSASSYLNLYLETRRTARLHATHPCVISTACSLSYNELKLTSPLAAKLLLLLSCYHHASIQSSILEYARYIPHEDQTKPGLLVNGHAMHKAIATLQDFSLITSNHEDGSESYNMHPTIQSWCRSMLNMPEHEPEHKHLKSTALTSLGRAAGSPNPGDPGTHAAQQTLLPHADAMHCLLQSDTPPRPTPQTLNGIISIGALYRAQGLLNDAEGMYLHALVHSEILHGRWHRTTRRIIRTLRRIRFLRGRMGLLVARFWWAPLLFRSFELVAGSVMIVVGLVTCLIFAIILFFAWLVSGPYRSDGDGDREMNVDGGSEGQIEEGGPRL